jgi:hypothetical protein
MLELDTVISVSISIREAGEVFQVQLLRKEEEGKDRERVKRGS